MDYKNHRILVDISSDHIATLTINNPPLNMVTLDTPVELYQTLRALDKDEEVRVVLLRGAGEKAFCVGSDLKEFPSVRDSVADKKLKMENDAFNMLELLSKPVIAVIEGYAYGGGCEMLCCCDIRIAGENARFSLPEINIGVVPCSGAMFRLPKLVGLGRAYEMMYLGEPVTAEYAEKIGFVNHIVPAGQAYEFAYEMARKIASKSNTAVSVVKKYAREMMEEASSANYHKNLDMADIVFTSPECLEGVAAFFEKRPPDFHKAK